MNTTSVSPQDQLFLNNLQYLNQVAAPLAEQIKSVQDKVLVKATQNNDFELIVDGFVVFDNIFARMDASLKSQIETPDRIISQRPVPLKSPQELTDLASSIVDTEDYVVLEQLEGLPLSTIEKQQYSMVAKDIVLFGAMSILYIDALVDSQLPSTSFLLVEKDPHFLCAALHLVDFQGLISKLKSLNVGFNLIFEPFYQDFGYRIQDHYGTKNPLAILGLRTFQAPSIASELIEAHAWCHSRDGLISMAQGMLGNDTDEYNQVMHATYNQLKYTRAHLITRDVLKEDEPVILVSSGPSLDSSLPVLKELEKDSLIVAAGSSIGTLLRSGITPSIVVLLEMSSAVFDAVDELVNEGFDLSNIILVASSTVDPRIPDLFKKVIFFHRPLSTAHAISVEQEKSCVLPQAGPQAANAALEVVLEMGSRNILLFGCDFGAVDTRNPRSSSAAGSSIRNLNMPVRGSHGRTVYSSDELSVTRNLFENSIALYAANVSSVGEGSWIQGVNHLPLDITPDKLSKYSSAVNSSDIFSRSVERPPLNKSYLRTLFKSVDKEFRHLPDQILSILDANSMWSHDTSNQLSKFICWNDANQTPAQIAVKRLTRFPLYFLCSPYHDLSGSIGDHNNEILSRTQRSLCQLSMLGSTLCSFLLELVATESLPEWSPEMARSSLHRIASTIHEFKN